MPSAWDVVEDKPTTPAPASSPWDVAEEKAPEKPKTWMQRIASWIPDSYGDTQEKIARTEDIGARKAGETIIEYSPITGVPEIASGLRSVVSPEKGTNRRQAARKVIGGVGKTLAPLAVPAAMAAPLVTAAGIAGGMAVQQGTERGLRALGVEEDTAGLVGDIAGFIPPGAAARKVVKGLRGKPKATPAAPIPGVVPPQPPAPDIPPPVAPIDIPPPLPKPAVPAPDVREGSLVTRLLSDERGSLTIPLDDIRAGALKARTQLTDEFAPVRSLTKPANLPVNDDPYVAMRLYAGHAGKIDNRLKGLRNILKPANAEKLLDPIRKYAVYERHEELAARIPNYKLPNGQTIADIQAEKAALEASLGPQNLTKVKGYVDGIRQYSDRLLTEAKDAGLISDESYTAIKANNEKYVPLQRLEYVADQLDQVPHGSKAFSVADQDVVRRIQGSEKEILDPLQAMIRNTYKTVSLIERNKVARKMANLSTRPEFQGVIEPLRSGSAPKTGNGKFSTLVDGVKYEYEAPLNIVEAMKGLNRKESDLVTKMASFSSRMLRAGATSLNVPFILSNTVRDLQTAKLVSSVGFGPNDWLRGVTAALKRNKDFDDFMESGGSFSGFYERNRSLPQSVRDLSESTGAKALRTIVDPREVFGIIPALQRAVEVTELAPRIGVYTRAKKSGLSQTEAGFAARNATVDFAKAGTATRVLNQWVPFLNARLQGTINTLGTVKDRPGHAALTLSTMVGLPVLSTWAWNRQFDDVLGDMAPYERESNFVVVYGREKDESGNYTQAIKIPKGDVGRIFGNPLENFLSYLEGKDPKAADQLAMQVMSDISPVSFEKEGKFSGSALLSSGLPPTIKAGVEGVTNQNLYTEREIVPKNLQDASPQEQYKADTPSWLVKLGEFTNISPLKWQNAIGTQFGGVGRQLSDPGKALGTIQRRFVGARGGEQEQKEWDVLAESKREAADVRVREDRTAKQLYDRLAKESPDKRRAIIEQGIADKSVTPQVLESMGAIIEKTESSALERNLKSSPVEARARYMLKRLNEVAAEERRSLFEKWQEQDLITPKVIEAIESQLTTQ